MLFGAFLFDFQKTPALHWERAFFNFEEKNMIPDAADSPIMNRQFRLAARPAGMPAESDFVLVETPLAALSDGQVLARAIFLSVDP